MTTILLTLLHQLPPLLCSSFSCITSSNRRQASLLLAGMGRNRSRPVGPSDRQGGVSDTIQDKTSSFPEPYSVSSLSSGIGKSRSSHQFSGGHASKRGNRISSDLLPWLLQSTIRSPKSFGIMETSHRLVNPEPIHPLPIIQDGDTSVCNKLPSERSMANITGFTGCILPHSDKPQEQTLSQVLPRYKSISISSPSFWSLHKPKSLHQGTEAGTGICSRTWSSAPHVSGRLAPQPNSYQKSRCQTLWLIRVCSRLGWIVNVAKSQLIPTQTLVYLGIHIDSHMGKAWPAEKRISKWLALAQEFLVLQAPPANLWLQVLGHLVSLEKLVPFGRIRIRPLQWQLKRHWKQESDLFVAQVPLDLSSNQSLVWWTTPGNLRQGICLGAQRISHFLFTDSSNMGWGAHVANLTASGQWSAEQRQLHINVLELLAVWLGLQAFVSHLSHSNVAIMCDNMAAIAYVKNQGGTHSETMCTLTSQICLWAELHKINMVARHVPGHLNVLADSLSRKNQILKSEWSMNQTIVDKVFRHWGSPHVDLFALKQNTKLPVFMSPIPDKTTWKVDCLIQNWRNLYAYAYPPTNLIRPCLNKVMLDQPELILIAPWWPNQEWFPDLLALSVDFPWPLPISRSLLKQTFSHQFHTRPEILNLHAWKLSPDLLKRRVFLGKCPKGSLFLQGNLLQEYMKTNG